MSSLRQTVSHPHAGENPGAVSGSGAENRRFGRDRRANERRSNVDSFENRNNRLRLAAQAAGFGTYDLDCTTGDSLWSPELRTMAGLPPTDEPLSMEQAEALIHPEDRGRLKERLCASLRPEGLGEFEDELRIQCPDGAIRWVKAKGRTFFAGDGAERRPLATTGVIMDITDRVKTEEAFRQSKEELELAARGADIGIWHWDLRNGHVELSERCRQLFGIQEDGPLRMEHVLAVIHPDDRDGVRAALRLAIEDGEEYNFEKRFVWPDGSIHWLACIGRDLYEETGRAAVGIRGISIDITTRKEAEQRLLESENRFRSTFEQIAVGLAHVALDGRLLRVNAKFSAIVGYESRELLAMTFQEITHPEDLGQDLDNVSKLLAGSFSGYAMEKRYIRKDGHPIWCNLTVSLVRKATGEPDYFVSVVEDIQARKDAERALAEEREARQQMLARQVAERTAEVAHSNEALMRSNIELKHFAHAAAHDLQTPLRSIAGFAQLLQQESRGWLAERELEWLNQIIGNTKRLQNLIQELLAYARLDALARPCEMTNLRDLFDQVLATLAVPIAESGAEVTCGDLPTLPVDRTQFAQLLQNLIENAIKYRSDEPPRVRISCQPQGGEWVFSVADNGLGIEPRHYRQIFEIFRRLHTYKDIPGTGIGLAICHRIVERHGGRIWVESERGKGSVFRFSLPAGGQEAVG